MKKDSSFFYWRRWQPSYRIIEYQYPCSCILGWHRGLQWLYWLKFMISTSLNVIQGWSYSRNEKDGNFVLKMWQEWYVKKNCHVKFLYSYVSQWDLRNWLQGVWRARKCIMMTKACIMQYIKVFWSCTNFEYDHICYIREFFWISPLWII